MEAAFYIIGRGVPISDDPAALAG